MAKKTDEGGIILSALEEDLLTAIRAYPQGVYGLQLIEKVNAANRSCKRREIGVGSLYPALKRMERQKLVAARWGEEGSEVESSKGARRRYYKITGLGSTALRETAFYRQQLSGEPYPQLI